MTEVENHIMDVLSVYEIEMLREILPLISEAGLLSHKNGSLLSHLCGTWKILNRKGCNSDVAIAGLMHSIYSTEHYRFALFSFSRRDYLIDKIGKVAERLVYLFCTLEKKEIWNALSIEESLIEVSSRVGGVKCAITLEEANQLLRIECANFIEQCSESDGSPKVFMAWYLRLARESLVFFEDEVVSASFAFSEEQESESISFYNYFLMSDDFANSRPLRKAVKLNPFSAELQFLLGVVDYVNGCPKAGRERFLRARSLMSSWCTSWDKRLTVKQWSMLLGGVQGSIDQENSKCMLDSIVDSIKNGRMSGVTRWITLSGEQHAQQ